MSLEIILALAAFALATSITPGPNNLMLMTSGANFGFLRTIPHMLGISLGHMFMMVILGIGLSQVFETYSAAQLILQVLSVLYMLYLAWRMANAASLSASQKKGRPLNFFEAAAFQWVNPKAWAMALTAISVYAADTRFLSILVVAALFSSINFPSVCVWTLLGTQLRRWLTTDRRLRRFNITMAVLLVASLWPVLRG